MSTKTKHTEKSIISAFLRGDFNKLDNMDFDPASLASNEDNRLVLSFIHDVTSGINSIPERESNRLSRAIFTRNRIGLEAKADEQTEELRDTPDPADRTEPSRYSTPSRKEHIGWVILDDNESYHKADYETAAWYTDYSIPAGAYPVYFNVQYRRLYFYVDNAVITDENFPSLFGGVSIGKGPVKKTNVGKTADIMLSLPDLYAMPIYREGVKVTRNRRFVLLDGIEINAKFTVLTDKELKPETAHISQTLLLDNGEERFS